MLACEKKRKKLKIYLNSHTTNVVGGYLKILVYAKANLLEPLASHFSYNRKNSGHTNEFDTLQGV